MSISPLSDKCSSLIALLGLVIFIVIVTMELVSLATDDSALSLAQSSTPPETSPQLVLHLQQRKITLKLAGTVVREYVISIAADPNKNAQSRGDRLFGQQTSGLTVRSVRLISAAEAIPPTELRIIAEESRLATDKLQRYIPQEMVMMTDGGLRIYVETDCENAKTSFWQQAQEIASRSWNGFLGRNSLRLGMSANDAMSLYGVVRGGAQLTILQ